MINRIGVIFARLTAIIAVVVVLNGCAVGYMSFPERDASVSPGAGRINQSQMSSLRGPLENTKITYNIPDYNFKVAFERTLREQWHIFDIMSLPELTGNEADRIEIAVQTDKKPANKLVNSWMIINGASFATIPAVVDDVYSRKFTVSLPGGRRKEYSYNYSVRMYSWLPLFLVANFMYSVDADIEDEQKFLDADSDVVNRFMADALPFILSISNQQGDSGQ